MTFPEKRPTIVGSVTTAAGLGLLNSESIAADAVEVRVDALLAANIPVMDIERALETRKHPVLLTLRIPEEGGQRAWETAERHDLYLRLLPWVEAIDVELATTLEMEAVIAAAKRGDKTVVLSAHSIGQPASEAQFAGWEAQHPAASKTILKVAAHIASWRDLQRLAALLVNHPEWEVAVMGVGPQAAASRSVLAALGSRLVYGYLDQPAAPGQPSAAELRETLRDFIVPDSA